MSRTRFTEVVRMIRSTLFFFITMSVVTALTVMTYTAISFSMESLENSCEQYYDDHNFYDLQISCSTGFNEKMLQTIRSNTKIDTADIGYCIQNIISVDGDNYVAEFYTLPGELNRVRLISGRIATGEDECTVEQALLDRFSLSIGDKIVLPTADSRMKNSEFTIVGSVDLVTVFVTNDFYNRGVSDIGDGQVTTKILLADTAFTEETVPNICVMTFRSKLRRGSDDYNTQLSEIREEIFPLVERMVTVEYETAEREASLSKKEAKRELDSAQRELERTDKRIEELLVEAERARAEIFEKRTDYMNRGFGEKEADSFLSERVQRLKKTENKTYEKFAEKVAAESRIKTAQIQIEEADAVLEKLIRPELGSSDIYSNPSYNSYVQMLKGTETVTVAICSLLIAISILVCFTTISRMVTEDHRIIGTQKAMGFRESEITAKYITYAILCSVFGGITGILVSYYYLQDIVFTLAYGQAFIMQDFVPVIDWKRAVGIILLDVVCLCLSAVTACRQMMKKSAIALLNSEIRDTVESREADSSRIPLSLAMTLRNLRGNPKILLTTIVSVTGCTVMMITAFTVRNAMGGIADMQYDKLQHYQGMLSVDDQFDPAEKDALADFAVNSGLVDTLPVVERFVAYQSRDKVRYATLICFDSDSDYRQFLELPDINTGENIDIPEDGILICRKMAENYGYTVGGRLSLTNESGYVIYADIKGIVERNIGMAIFTSTQYYEKLLRETPEITQFYVKGTQENITKFCDEARSYPAFCNYADSGYYRSEMEFKISSVNSIIYVVLVITWVLSLFVLFSLAQMNICKKEKDIVVMKVLGFPPRRVKGYVFWECMIMCMIGLVVGVALGGPVGSYIVSAIELEELQSIRGISIPACVAGAAVNFVFCTAANIFSLRNIRKIKMTGSAREA